ncbi:thiopurine S-methyltransferase [Thalassotalea sp. G2M2-11]|uniref:thiopurine S-methyltransferase n=1 Tax=Thalassotalea sp. G2M2-11 TaxID=2787627 RepID=UPI001F4932C4|nr:thiopurine S-methyltransferase [Thalassotalea sp. G2M2-11]
MKASFWHACWERNSIGFHQADVHPFLAKYLQPRLQAQDSTVFVPLCGKSADMVWLADHMTVVGAELSDIACRDFFIEKQLDVSAVKQHNFNVYQYENVSLWQGDFFQLIAKQLPAFDWIYDRAAIIALPEAMQQAYVEQLSTFMSEHSQLFLVSLEFPASEMSGPPFPITSERIEQLFQGFEIEHVARHELADKTFAQRRFEVSYLIETLYIIRRKRA